MVKHKQLNFGLTQMMINWSNGVDLGSNIYFSQQNAMATYFKLRVAEIYKMRDMNLIGVTPEVEISRVLLTAVQEDLQRFYPRHDPTSGIPVTWIQNPPGYNIPVGGMYAVSQSLSYTQTNTTPKTGSDLKKLLKWTKF